MIRENVEFIGVDPYHFCETGEVVCTVTANVGQSTAIGPKVAIRRKRPFLNLKDVIGTIDASIYSKNNFQDNSKYIIRKKERTVMQSPIECFKEIIGKRKDAIDIIATSETCLRIVEDGIMTISEAITALSDLREQISGGNLKVKESINEAVKAGREVVKETYGSIAEAIRDINKDAPHQQDQLNCQYDAARTLAASTHGAASHLTKTCIETEDEDGNEMCIVRRLTPTETSRLQGFPDDYTQIDGPETADSPQFKAHGNSWATPCSNFISTRIEMELKRMNHDGSVRYATCCSGIEAQSVSVKNLDWKSLFFSEIEPFPCRVLAKHYPDTPNLGDMTQIHYDSEKGVITNEPTEKDYTLDSCFTRAPIIELPFKEGELDVFSGGTPCFTKGVVVLTKEGYKPIEIIKVGDEVLTHLGRFKKVVRIGSKISNDLVRVSIVGREAIVCTADHPFPLMKPHRRKSGKYYFDSPVITRIKDGKGLYAQTIATDINDFGVDIPELPIVYKSDSRDIYELCGWYVGDGYIRGWKDKSKKAVILCLNHKDVDVFNKRFSGKLNYTITRSDGIFKVHIFCTAFANFLHDNFGELAYGKKIPMWVYRESVRNEFLKGYFQTDGCTINNGKGIQWSTVSQSLAYGVADLVGDTCVNISNVPPTTVICGRTVNQRNFYTVRHHIYSNHFHKVGMFDVVKVKSVEKLIGESDRVYNIEVEDDHTYVVNGIVTHNCQSVSVAGKREGMAEGSGTRSSLAFHFQRIIDELKPTFTIWENVPGAFSSNGGADFIWFVNKCAESGYQMAWRVLDAQYVMTEEFPRAVPQRRRRIWLVGYRGSDWRVPARVCFENKDELTELPPERIPEMGFKTVNKDCEFTIVRDFGCDEQGNDGLMGLVMESDDGRRDLLKVSRMIDFKDLPEETDFSKVPMATIYEFAKKIGNPLYIGDVFRKDKKRQAITVDSTLDLFSMLDEGGDDKEKEDEKVEENTEWVGAEKITPAILENIGNAGILANGRICTMSCPEWTSGIQLSPQKYNAWEEVVRHKEWLKANGLLPEAYNETVCGLSDVLQEDPDEKYNLSWRACFGILRRAEARAKELPPALHIALISTIRENAGIVKWYALNGRDTKKKETDVSEREAAMICFDKYISSKVSFDDVVPEEPKKSTSEDEDADDEELNVADGGDIVDFDGDEMEDDE